MTEKNPIEVLRKIMFDEDEEQGLAIEYKSSANKVCSDTVAIYTDQCMGYLIETEPFLSIPCRADCMVKMYYDIQKLDKVIDEISRNIVHEYLRWLEIDYGDMYAEGFEEDANLIMNAIFLHDQLVAINSGVDPVTVPEFVSGSYICKMVATLDNMYRKIKTSDGYVKIA